jgi:hypothetical protein
MVFIGGTIVAAMNMRHKVFTEEEDGWIAAEPSQRIDAR